MNGSFGSPSFPEIRFKGPHLEGGGLKEVLESLALLVRLGPFLIAVVLLTLWFALLTPLLFMVWLVVTPLWFVVTVPFKFVSAAMSNEIDCLRDELSVELARWRTMPVEHSRWIRTSYRAVWEWLIGSV